MIDHILSLLKTDGSTALVAVAVATLGIVNINPEMASTATGVLMFVALAAIPVAMFESL